MSRLIRGQRAPMEDPADLHEMEEIIQPGEFPYVDIYGPWFVGDAFKPHMKNIYTGVMEQRAHHAGSAGSKTRASF
ncbi:unnamed protein product [Periconia digitata]|uniref:Uncharacterized protein n=1 Tax=Periconia digitata TaxID=1303443 RepID=A0A9W4UPD8_9PLEO|nr:unnamed protein product [Periconia digitata]